LCAMVQIAVGAVVPLENGRSQVVHRFGAALGGFLRIHLAYEIGEAGNFGRPVSSKVTDVIVVVVFPDEKGEQGDNRGGAPDAGGASSVSPAHEGGQPQQP